MAKGIDTNTIVMIAGLGLLGFGMFYMMNKQQGQGPAPGSFEQRVNQATNDTAEAAGVSNQAQMDEMRGLIAAMMQKSQGMSKWEKQMEEKKLQAAYVQMGITGGVATLGAIAGFFT